MSTARKPNRSRTTPPAAGLTFAALTPGRWPDLERLFGPNGACGGCWCMWWKQSAAEFARGKGAGNKRRFKAQVMRGTEPGFLAYRDGVPIGWCAVEPRERYAVLARSRLLAPVDERPVWSVTCFFVKAGQRRTGVGLALLLEGYPKDGRAFSGANANWMGRASTFRRAGFEEVARRSATRPIMRRAA